MARIKTIEDYFTVKQSMEQMLTKLRSGMQFIALDVHENSTAISGDVNTFKNNYVQILININHIVKVYP